MSKLVNTTYRKKNSFESTRLIQRRSDIKTQLRRAVDALENIDICNIESHFSNFYEILKKVKKSLNIQLKVKDSNLLGAAAEFQITELVAEELALIPKESLTLYLYHRYRYEIFPQSQIIDDYPPYVQIEPSSICNYRCKFCFQTDETFSNYKSSHMGTMNFETYKKIVDLLQGKTEFLSLASRGEPFICKDLPKMLNYSANKFLNLKINTNASLLDEKRIHALLSGGARTIVFSIDAATKELYELLRVNGRIENIEKKLKLFSKIRDRDYKDSPNIVRVSGVYLDDKQNMNSMENQWGEYVDQITFVKYNSWENVYESPLSEVDNHCSDLWRRLFIWFDGKLNPCDTDYKSTLLIGNVNEFGNLSEIWKSREYEKYRNLHINKKRDSLSPCNKCSVI